jgi:hypothetical protein
LAQAVDLDPKSVQSQVARREGAHDVLHISFVLTATHRPDSREWFGFQVNSSPVVEIGAALVIHGSPALHYGYEGEDLALVLEGGLGFEASAVCGSCGPRCHDHAAFDESPRWSRSSGWSVALSLRRSRAVMSGR